jgi:phosphate starvation-inducible protein PhoH and related proteins
VSSASAASREFDLEPADNSRLASLCGPLDANLRLVESRLGVEIRRRGHAFRVKGARAAATEVVLRDLFAQTKHQRLTAEQVHLCLVEHANDRSGNGNGNGGGNGNSRGTGGAEQGAAAATLAIAPAGHDAEPDTEAAGAAVRGTVRARGAHQREYLANIQHHDLSFGIGPAGTGKTYLAVACAVEALLSERVRRIVLVRPAVEAGERLGFLPGDMAQKVDPYLRPMYDALYEMMGFQRVARFIERNAIEVAPLAFMRGRSLNESFIILDEAQNTTIEQMKMFLTRIGFGARAVVTGDLTQTDLPSGRMSGLQHAQLILRGVQGVAFTLFDAGDVVRHPLVQRIVQAYESHETTREP